MSSFDYETEPVSAEFLAAQQYLSELALREYATFSTELEPVEIINLVRETHPVRKELAFGPNYTDLRQGLARYKLWRSKGVDDICHNDTRLIFEENLPVIEDLETRIMGMGYWKADRPALRDKLLFYFDKTHEQFEKNAIVAGVNAGRYDVNRQLRHEIATQLFTEWVEYARLSAEMRPTEFSTPDYRSWGSYSNTDIAISEDLKRPVLAYRGITGLKQLIHDFPELPGYEVLAAFRKNTLTMNDVRDHLIERIDEKTADRQLKNQRHKDRNETRYNGPGAGRLTYREKATRFSARQEVSKSLELLPQLEVGGVLPIDDVSDFDDTLFTIASGLQNMADETYGLSTGNSWKMWVSNKQVQERILPKKFFGSLENPRLFRLPVDEEFVKKYLKDDQSISVDNVMRLAAIVDMRSTGRGIIGSSVVECVLYFRDIEDPEKRAIVKSLRGQASGDKIAEFLHLTSSFNGFQLEQRAILTAFPAGLPSLGKHR